MRIIGGKDYYDSAAAWGVDMTRVFERKKMLIETRKEKYGVDPIPHWNGLRINHPENKKRYVDILNDTCSWSFFKIFVAGRIISGIVVVERDRYYQYKMHCFYDGESFWEFIRKKTGLKETPKSSDTLYPKPWFSCFVSTRASDADTKQAIEDRVTVVYPSFLVNHFSNHGLIINGDDLKSFKVAKLINAVEMHQNIFQWISSMISPEHEMVEVSNEMKIAKHGMDKTSFRKPKIK